MPRLMQYWKSQKIKPLGVPDLEVEFLSGWQKAFTSEVVVAEAEKSIKM